MYFSKWAIRGEDRMEVLGVLAKPRGGSGEMGQKAGGRLGQSGVGCKRRCGLAGGVGWRLLSMK